MVVEVNVRTVCATWSVLFAVLLSLEAIFEQLNGNHNQAKLLQLISVIIVIISTAVMSERAHWSR
jgi:uncharacterized membrane protein